MAITLGVAGCSAQVRDTTKRPISEIATTPVASTTPPAPTSPEADTTFLPQRFTVTYRPGEPVAYECRITGDTVTCTVPSDPLAEGIISWTTVITGALSGPTMTGTATTDVKARRRGNPECISHQHSSGPVTYVFSPDGTVAIRHGPDQWQTTYSGNCPDNPSGYSETVQLWEGTGTWSKVG